MEAARRAALALQEPAAWFLACDNDADGLCAAAVMVQAMRRKGHRVQVRASRDKTEAAYRALLDVQADGLMLLDKGTSHLSLLAGFAGQVIVLDHHNLPETHDHRVLLVNPRAEGMDGSRDASSSTVAVAVALAMDARNVDLIPIGLSGAIGDWQHVPAWQGYNLALVEQGLAAKQVQKEAVPRLIDVTLPAAVARTLGCPLEEATALLDDLDIDAGLEAEELDRDARTRLVSAIANRFLDAGDVDLERLVRMTLWNPRLGTSLRHVYRIVDACGRRGHAGTGIAYLLGDPQATKEAQGHFAAYKEALHAGLQELAKGATRRGPFYVHWTQDASLTGMVAGLGVEHVLPEPVPLVVLARRPDGRVQVSTRATHAHTEAGLDLGRAVQRAAAAVGAEGGGHPIAAGAVIEDAEAFLAALEDAWP